MHGKREEDEVGKKLIATISMAVALASAAPAVAGAETGQPQQGGGCNMVFGPAFHAPNASGLTHMMAGASTAGAAGMADMLKQFSDLEFCLG
jgi:hypothetical protein